MTVPPFFLGFQPLYGPASEAVRFRLYNRPCHPDRLAVVFRQPQVQRSLFDFFGDAESAPMDYSFRMCHIGHDFRPG